MKQKQLERRFTFAADLTFCLYALLVMFIGAGALTTIQGSGITFLEAVCLWVGLISFLVYRAVSFRHQLNLHETGLYNLAAEHNGWQLQTDPRNPVIMPELFDASLWLIADRDRETLNYLTTPDWNYIDVSYNIYWRSKYSDYKAEVVYYSIFVTKLPRILPNVFFDSKTEGGRQYKAKFTKDQRHGLEGNFDKYFDTYFAEDYTIDSMSFITPDVMQALKDASNYDIEIVGDRLLLYGPVYIDAAQVTDGAAKLLAILDTLKVTAAAYRDDRLPGAAAAQTVTPEGLQLRRKRNPVWLLVIYVIVFIIIRVAIDRHNL